MVGDCGPMGMGRGSDGPMVMVEVRRWRFLFHLFFFFFPAVVCGRGFGLAWVVGHRSWVCVCVMGFGSPIWFWFLWVLVRRDGSAGCFCSGWVVVGCDFGGWLWLYFGFFLFLFFLQGVVVATVVL